MERIPIYLDSNVIIDMADGRNDELIGLLLRSIYAGPYIYPFTAEQISEITDVKTPDRNNIRLALLGDISRNSYFENSIRNLGFRTELPRTIYETINEVPEDEGWKDWLSNVASYEQLKEVRDVYGLSPAQLNNMSATDAVKAIDSALSCFDYGSNSNQTPPRSINDMLTFSENNIRTHFKELWEQLGADIESQILSTKIVSLFSLIDTFGFWSDTKSTFEKASRMGDSRHAFNGVYFSKVISRDTRFLKKTKATYAYLGKKSELHSTDEFKVHLNELLRNKY